MFNLLAIVVVLTEYEEKKARTKVFEQARRSRERATVRAKIIKKAYRVRM